MNPATQGESMSDSLHIYNREQLERTTPIPAKWGGKGDNP